MNYAELSMAISDWLNKDQIDKVIPTIVRFGQRDLEDNLRIRPMEYHPATAAISAATASLALPSDYLQLIYLQFTLNGVRYPVRLREDPAELYDLRPSTTETGVPQFVSRVADDLVFDVLTDVGYTRDWAYYRRLPVLSPSTVVPLGGVAPNSNWWSENAEEALLMSCLNKASLYVTGITEGDKKKWEEGYLLNLDRLRTKEARETTGGNVIRSANWR
jgi:hypothetical protein